MYQARPLVNGFPGKTATHGSFGWSSVWLLQGRDRLVMVETGPPSYVPLLTAALAAQGRTTSDVTDVLLTHAHWDHLGNVSLFPGARRWIGRSEYSWARAQVPEEPFVSQPLLDALDRPEGLLRLVDGEDELFPGVRAHEVPGHTPGHLAFAVDTTDGPLLFVGDAAKNVHELESVQVDSAWDKERGARTVTRIRDLARSTKAAVVPGHDVVCDLTDDGWRRRVVQTAEMQFFQWRNGPPRRLVISDEAPRPADAETIPPEGGGRPHPLHRQARAEY